MIVNRASFLTSSIGRKVLVAVTGLGLVAFLVVHLLGNLQLFLGAEAFNAYAALLKSMPGLLWVARIGLLTLFLVHLGLALQLTIENQKSRPAEYAARNTVQATLASRTMILSGSFILFYVVGHLLHFTLGIIHPEYFHLVDPKNRHDVYSMLVLGFQDTRISVAYVVAMVALGLHLSHGIASVFQTLGVRRRCSAKLFDQAGRAVAALIVLGYIAIPLSVMIGLLQLPEWR